MSNNSFRKFLKTTDKNVVSIMKQYQKDSEKFVNDCALANEKYNVKFMGSVDLNGSYKAKSVEVINGDVSKLPGQWTKPNSSGFTYPYKNNKEGNALLNSLTLPAPNLPGISMFSIENSDNGLSYSCYTAYFLFNDTVWVSVGNSVKVNSPEWEPIKHWEYEKALDESKEEMKEEDND